MISHQIVKRLQCTSLFCQNHGLNNKQESMDSYKSYNIAEKINKITNRLHNQEGDPKPEEANPKSKDPIVLLKVQRGVSIDPKVFQQCHSNHYCASSTSSM